MSIVEKVAAVLAGFDGFTDLSELSSRGRELYLQQTRHLIAALRTPTPAMLAAAVERSDRLADEVDELASEEDGFRAIFEAMIDAGMGDGK